MERSARGNYNPERPRPHFNASLYSRPCVVAQPLTLQPIQIRRFQPQSAMCPAHAPLHHSSVELGSPCPASAPIVLWMHDLKFSEATDDEREPRRHHRSRTSRRRRTSRKFVLRSSRTSMNRSGALASDCGNAPMPGPSVFVIQSSPPRTKDRPRRSRHVDRYLFGPSAPRLPVNDQIRKRVTIQPLSSAGPEPAR
ncbi:hypothetical protein GGE60_005556 [Rhizobium leucaenae]|uniref:Uncharacterized protein n=1 Tax=Rhizobium leucaenae TaxID=29450 RepID=A0A7W7EMV8_9HYPH|nr:hypothetical protein [Rhizobium leucaenae]